MAYNILAPIQIFTNQSMGADATSTPTETKEQDNVGIQLQWTGTPQGAFSVQVSMDYKVDSQGNVTNPGTWISLAISPGVNAVGAADQAYIDLNQLSAPYVRVMYGRTAGTGTLNGFITAKGV